MASRTHVARFANEISFELQQTRTRSCISTTFRRTFPTSNTSTQRLNGLRGSGPIRHLPQGSALHMRSRASYISHGKHLQRRYRSGMPNVHQTPGIGAEPGLGSDQGAQKMTTGDPNDKPEPDVQIVDYSEDRLQVEHVDSVSLDRFLRDNPKPSWSACRWICINGTKLDAIRSLGRQKNLHPLALEDVLDTRTPTKPKVNWYEEHCYLEMQMVKLLGPHHGCHGSGSRKLKEMMLQNHTSNLDGPRQRTLAPGKLAVSLEQVSNFLTADGTVITIFEHSSKDVFDPVLARLQSAHTVLRSSNDASMLLQAIVDTVVDLSLPIGETVAEIFSDLENQVLENPTISQSKQLHILRSGLTLLLNNTIAIAGLVKTLCDHHAVSHLNRSMDYSPTADSPSLLSASTPSTYPPSSTSARSPAPLHPSLASVQISPMARIYFQDVSDHLQTLSDSTHTAIRSAENLSTLIFNSITASQNESVRMLTLVSGFFLPLTFLTSYFGMNLDMPSCNNHGESFFWALATPTMVGTALLILVGAKWRRIVVWFQRVGKGKRRT